MSLHRAEVRFEHFLRQLANHEGLSSLGICFGCLMVIVALGVVVVQRMFFAPQNDSVAQRSKRYDELLGHIRGLEALRSERELLVQRVVRVVQGWGETGSASGAAPGDAAAKFARESIDQLGDNVRSLKREHQLMLRHCIAALGQHDASGVFRVEAPSDVWQKAMAQAATASRVEELLDTDDDDEVNDGRKRK